MRFRHAKNMTDSEALTIMRALADNVRSYEQAVEVSGARDSAECFIWPRSPILRFRTAPRVITTWNRAPVPGLRALTLSGACTGSHGRCFRPATILFREFFLQCSLGGNETLIIGNPDVSPNTGGSSLPTSTQSVPAVRLRASSTCEGKKTSRTAGWAGVCYV